MKIKTCTKMLLGMLSVCMLLCGIISHPVSAGDGIVTVGEDQATEDEAKPSGNDASSAGVVGPGTTMDDDVKQTGKNYCNAFAISGTKDFDKEVSKSNGAVDWLPGNIHYIINNSFNRKDTNGDGEGDENPKHQRCRKMIRLNNDIDLKTPIVIDGPNDFSWTEITAKGEKIAHKGLVIDGQGHSIDASALKNGESAIEIKSPYVTIRNLNITGDRWTNATIPAKTTEDDEATVKKGDFGDAIHGIFVSPGAELTVLDAVRVGFFSGKGISLLSERNVIKNLSAVVFNGDVGVFVKSLGVWPNINEIEPSTLIVGNNKYGCLDPSITTTSMKGPQIVVEDQPPNVQFKYSGDTNKYNLNGYVLAPVSGTSGGSGSGKGEAGASATVYFYRFEPKGLKEKNLSEMKLEDALIGYVGKGHPSVPTTFDLTKAAMPATWLPESGSFNVDINPSDMNDYIYVLAQPTSIEAATTSPVVGMMGYSGDNEGSFDPSEGLCGTTAMDPDNMVDGDDLDAETAKDLCKAKSSLILSGEWDAGEDTDEDGIPNILEDISRICVTSVSAKSTDFANADSDRDGLPDAVEDKNVNGFVDCYMTNDEYEKDDTKAGYCTRDHDKVKLPCIEKEGKIYVLVKPSMRKTTGSIEIPDPDAMGIFISTKAVPGIPSTFDPSKGFCTETDPRTADTDGDGIDDGMEDRQAKLKQDTDTKFRLYYYEATFVDGDLNPKNSMVIDEDTGEPVSCKIVDETAMKLGVEYKYTYTVQPTDEEKEHNVDPKKYRYVVCKNGNLLPTDFNGTYDQGRGETDPLDPDTDDDGYCDGGVVKESNSGVCKDLKGLVEGKEVSLVPGDKCPEIKLLDNNCFEQCYNGWRTDQIKQMALKNAMTEDEMKLKIDALLAKGTIAAKNELEGLSGLGKMDLDGIPDIVESESDNCGRGSWNTDPFQTFTDLTSLNSADLNEAELLLTDATDPCPGRADKLTIGTDGKVTITCKESRPYASHIPLYACYVDRDKDGAFDCEEDIDLNGQFDKGSNGRADTIYRWGESDPLNPDSDADGLKDGIEIHGMEYTVGKATNPNSPDTDGDELSDFVEVNFDGDSSMYQKVSDNYKGTCDLVSFDGTLPTVSSQGGIVNKSDTDPTVADTDGDGLDDAYELMKMLGGKISTNPNNPDSDNDRLCDGDVEIKYADGSSRCIVGEDRNTDGSFPYYDPSDPSKLKLQINESNPCEANTDDPENLVDQMQDIDDPCPTNADLNAKGCGENSDSDSDGLFDSVELTKTMTDPNNDDSDGDGLPDGCVNGKGELCQQVFAGTFNANWRMMNIRGDSSCSTDWTMCDTNPNDRDTDKDQLTDDLERQLGTSPLKPDTDGDCLTDYQEDTFHIGNKPAPQPDGFYSAGQDTNPLAVDTDNDGLADGLRDAKGEDTDCSGFINVNEKGEYTETDPRSADTDNDGLPDFDEAMVDGGFNPAGALSAGRGGCSLMVGGSADWSALAIILSLLAGILVLRKRI